MLGKVIIYLISIILIINLLNLRGINIKLNKYQLQAYENLGSIRNSKLSYNRLKNVLKNINDFNYDVFIQGSYANKTNIPGDSDVDVIINLNDIFNHNINEHSKEDQEDFHRNHSNAKLSIKDFYDSVLSVLNDSNYNFLRKKKCLKISGTPLNVDLVVSNNYHNYTKYPNYIEGIKVYTSNNENIVSYPKLHKKNGFNKNSRVNSNYKRTVRIFKNIKSYLVSNSVISESIVSSYFIECLLYNVPDNYYQNYNIEKRFFGILNYLLNEPNFMEMKTQDEQNYLFGDSDNQWDKKHALKFLNWVNSFNR
jgi:hypothetical protein